MEKLTELFRDKSHSEIALEVKSILTSESIDLDVKFINDLTQYLLLTENEWSSSLNLDFIQYLLKKKEYLVLLDIVPKLKILKSYKYKYLIEASEELGKVALSKKLRIEYIEFLLGKKNYELSEKIIKNSEEKYHKDSLYKIYALNLYYDIANYSQLQKEFKTIRSSLHKKNIKSSSRLNEREFINYLLSIFNDEDINELNYNLIKNELLLHKLHLEVRDSSTFMLRRDDWALLLEAMIWGKSDLKILTLVMKILWNGREYELAKELFISIEKRPDYNFLEEIKNDNEIKRIILDLRERSKIKNYVDGTDIRIKFDKLDDLLISENQNTSSVKVEEVIKEYQEKTAEGTELADIHLAKIINEGEVGADIEEICVAALQLGFKKSLKNIIEKKYQISKYLKLHCLKFLEMWGEALIICDEIIGGENTDIVLLKRTVYERGLISIKMKKIQKAKKDLKLLTQIDPNNKEIEKLSNEIKKNE